MAEFTVGEVIDGDTFKVKEGLEIESKELKILSVLLDIMLQKKERQDTKKPRRNSKD
jgi:hypothetical protein